MIYVARRHELSPSLLFRWRGQTSERVRPKMMTVIAIMAGLVPILWSHGTGSEVMRRIAVPMIGGMVSSTILTLLVIPAIYAVVKGMGLDSKKPPGTVDSFQPFPL